MRNLTPAEARTFLLARPRTAKLASVRADGRPHIAPIWFDLDGDDILFTTWHTTVKYANLTRDPRLALCVDDDVPPYAFVIVEGTAVLSGDLDLLLHWATRIAGRYMGSQLAGAYGKRNAVPGEWLVRLTPTKMIARTNISD